MRTTFAILILLACITLGPRSAPGAQPAVALDEELRLMLSNPTVLQQMHALASRQGMHLAAIEREAEAGTIVSHTIVFMGGVVPQNTATFKVRTALEGPPPLSLTVIDVTPVVHHAVVEGPPKL